MVFLIRDFSPPRKERKPCLADVFSHLKTEIRDQVIFKVVELIKSGNDVPVALKCEVVYHSRDMGYVGAQIHLYSSEPVVHRMRSEFREVIPHVGSHFVMEMVPGYVKGSKIKQITAAWKEGAPNPYGL